METILLVIVVSTLSALPIILIKNYIATRKKYFDIIIIAIILNIIVTYLYIPLLEIIDATVIYTIIKILSVIIIALIAYFYLNERLKTKQILGIIIGIISLILLTT